MDSQIVVLGIFAFTVYQTLGEGNRPGVMSPQARESLSQLPSQSTTV